jgi:hypothetical protein
LENVWRTFGERLERNDEIAFESGQNIDQCLYYIIKDAKKLCTFFYIKCGLQRSFLVYNIHAKYLLFFFFLPLGSSYFYVWVVLSLPCSFARAYTSNVLPRTRTRKDLFLSLLQESKVSLLLAPLPDAQHQIIYTKHSDTELMIYKRACQAHNAREPTFIEAGYHRKRKTKTA